MNIPEEAIEAAAVADWTSYVEHRAPTPADYPEFAKLPEDIRANYREDVRPMIEAAAPILTAPRTITTLTEADALPNGSVILTRFGCSAQKDTEWENPDGDWWITQNPDPYHFVPLDFPATVLYTPNAPAVDG